MSRLYAASTLLLLSLPQGFAAPVAQDLPDIGLPPFQLLNATAAAVGPTAPTTGEVTIQIAPSEPIVPGITEPAQVPSDMSDLTGGVLADEPQITSLDPDIDDGTWLDPNAFENELSDPVPQPLTIPLETPIVNSSGPEASAEVSAEASVDPIAVDPNLPLDWESFGSPDDSVGNELVDPLPLPTPIPEPTPIPFGDDALDPVLPTDWDPDIPTIDSIASVLVDPVPAASPVPIEPRISDDIGPKAFSDNTADADLPPN
ncbi:hypothetical protein EK21DRAFT_84257 [Setomelanomma holmii]|uniref:Uncharacterized protein n=1 Tax=Setomelanomma holmii TaxID=210430 RepID=A0A9P4HIP0_9PLEO|nr:hypothetical protein EK21DRAFT_84257 [Setomelanomma holmii]